MNQHEDKDLPEHLSVFSSRPSLMKGLLILVMPTRWGQSMLRLVHWSWPPSETLIRGADDVDGDCGERDSLLNEQCGRS